MYPLYNFMKQWPEQKNPTDDVFYVSVRLFGVEMYRERGGWYEILLTKAKKVSLHGQQGPYVAL